MKIATWNVNSLRVRLPQLAHWVQDARPDILALQETKVVDADFPRAEVEGEIATDQIRAVDRTRLIRQIGTLDPKTEAMLSAKLVEMFQH